MDENPARIEQEKNSLENLILHIMGNIVPHARFFHFFNGVLDPGDGNFRTKSAMSAAEAEAACNRLKIDCLARLEDQNLDLPLFEEKNRKIIQEILKSIQGDWNDPDHIARLNELVIALTPSDFESARAEEKKTIRA